MYLENKSIKAPKLYKTDKEVSEQYKETVDKLISQRNTLIDSYKSAETRSKEIPEEINQLNSELRRTLDKKLRKKLKANITELEKEQEELKEVLSIDIKEIMRDKVAESGVYDLKAGSGKEYGKWVKEMNVYWELLQGSYLRSKTKLSRFRDFNIYKTTNKKLDNLERYLMK